MAKDIKTYYEQLYIDNTLRLREILYTLPVFVRDYFRVIEPSTSSKTRISYAYDLRVFFNYLIESNPRFRNHNTAQFTIEEFECIESGDLEEYLEYLKVYISPDEKQITNTERGRARKFSSLCSLYRYLYKHKYISQNPSVFVDKPKLHDKAIIRLDVDEVAQLLDEVESGENLSARQQMYHQRTKTRDLALLTLLLGTGIRVSECVGLDLNDVDFKNNGIKVHRKGGAEVIVYFGDEVMDALADYMEERNAITPVEGHTNALFLSLQNKRITVRAVEKLVKKYSKLVTNVKKITPHKLRSTYGTTLYQETGDIYLVADVLGHKDVNTTRKHYAALEEDRRRRAGRVVKLRDV